MIIIKDVQSFLEEHRYHFRAPVPKSQSPRWVVIGRSKTPFDEYLGDSLSLGGALLLALNHWLSGELGRKWDRQLWQSVAYLFDKDERSAIENAIAWHEALEKEAAHES